MALYVFLALLALAVALKPEQKETARVEENKSRPSTALSSSELHEAEVSSNGMATFHRSLSQTKEIQATHNEARADSGSNTVNQTIGVMRAASTNSAGMAAIHGNTIFMRLHERPDIQVQHEILLNSTSSDMPAKSKIVAALLSFTGLGCCGIDRCYMNEPFLGIAKGLTLGGLGVWAIIDWFVIMLNCLSRDDSIASLSFQAQWNADTIETGHTLGVISAVLSSCLWCCLCSAMCFIRSWAAATKNKPKPGRRSFSGPASAPKMSPKPRKASEVKKIDEKAEDPTSLVPPAAEEVKNDGAEKAEADQKDAAGAETNEAETAGAEKADADTKT
mmetsp:Transcript_12027/g.21329  ORF Transcript_12027/g.21329 Transcript_12027/m.21329 type:complete len:333 (-) Transcript_12027:284-1282(-)|eukprot:CAMPEP_0197660828 /NCGR_PEP_ID=MMETSP1338-20131121/51084_1 /TAXON_ID=43686 ORGANISM="Pelagodinium beii, Strain RCC1491" /NCGR_SAMPLE_ID=MMETSP1338 /ASSEMBLY_ACC=CAM_ASM_000754 /LENGTH=332 /DNA_ID=CAMNT_0043238261 /DNA_START=48 /DNA_END=1046 /DNA_ORIENTATION=-